MAAQASQVHLALRGPLTHTNTNGDLHVGSANMGDELMESCKKIIMDVLKDRTISRCVALVRIRRAMHLRHPDQHWRVVVETRARIRTVFGVRDENPEYLYCYRSPFFILVLSEGRNIAQPPTYAFCVKDESSTRRLVKHSDVGMPVVDPGRNGPSGAGELIKMGFWEIPVQRAPPFNDRFPVPRPEFRAMRF